MDSWEKWALGGIGAVAAGLVAYSVTKKPNAAVNTTTSSATSPTVTITGPSSAPLLDSTGHYHRSTFVASISPVPPGPIQWTWTAITSGQPLTTVRPGSTTSTLYLTPGNAGIWTIKAEAQWNGGSATGQTTFTVTD